MHLPALSSAYARAAIAPALIFITAAIDRNYLQDFWHHLARGRAIVEQGQLVDTDQFTFTVAGRPFQDPNWLTQVCYYGLFQLGGLSLVRICNALVLAATMGLLVHCCRRRSGSLPLAAGLSVFTFLGLWQVLTIRPQTSSLFLFVLLFLALDRSEQNRRWLILPPTLLALWVNLHGGFPVGLLLIGCFLAGAGWEAWWSGNRRVWTDERFRQLALCLAVSVLATLVNPYGWRVYEYVLGTSAAATGRNIDEWLPPNVNLWIGKVWVASLLLVIATFAVPGRRPTARDVLLVLCFLPLACGAARMIPWWLLVLAPIAAGRFAQQFSVEKSEPEKPSFAGFLIFGLILVSVVMSLPGLSRYNPLTQLNRSAARVETNLELIAERIRTADPKSRVYSSFEWGEYLSWSLSPDGGTVFMDGRIEIYPDRVFAEHLAVSLGRADWQDTLNRYQVTALVLNTRYHAALLSLVRHASSGWDEVLQVEDAVLFLRRCHD